MISPNCTVLITGGAGVLGGEIACALVGCNANVVILDRDQELAQKVIERFPKNDQRTRSARLWRCAQARNVATGK